MNRNFKKSILTISSVLMVLVMMLTGCGSKKDDNGDNGSGSKDKLKVALILPGKADDVSFNQAMYEGMMALADEYKDKIEVKVVEEVYEVADIEPALMDFASEGYDLIFGHGFQFMEPIVKVGAQFPNTAFALGTGYKTLDNTCVYDVHLDSGGYIMGTLAALMSKTGKIGVVGGADVAEIYRGHEAFKYAAKQINPNIEIQELYTGDWRDQASAKEGAISMYDSGVDIIWHSGDGIGLGVVDAGKTKDKLVLGNVADQNVLAPNNVLSGVVYNWKPIIKEIIDDVLDGSFMKEKDKFYWITAANEGLKYAPFYGLETKVPKEVQDKVAEVYKGLQDGTIKIPKFDK